MTHEVKILPEYYDKIVAGLKTFEVRYDDRGYSDGDILVLREWRNGIYTGNIVEAFVTDVYRGEYCKEGYCLLSLKVMFPVSVQISNVQFLKLYDMFLQQQRESDRLKRELDELKEVQKSG